jgi:hypothetical protein
MVRHVAMIRVGPGEVKGNWFGATVTATSIIILPHQDISLPKRNFKVTYANDCNGPE